MALAHAGIPMKEMVSAIAIGKVDKTLVVDVNKEEEDFKEGEGSTDIPIAITSRNKNISLMQLDGKISPDELKLSVEMAKKACEEILKVPTKALKDSLNEEDKQNE